MTNDQSDAKLLALFAQLAGSVMLRGLDYARRDDPHTYASALRWMRDGGSRFELRTRTDPSGAVSVRGVVCDEQGEPICAVFTLSGAPADDPTNPEAPR